MKNLIFATVAVILTISCVEAMPSSEAYAIVAKQTADAKAAGFDGFCGSSPILPHVSIPTGWSVNIHGVMKGTEGHVVSNILSKDSFWGLSRKFGEEINSVILLSYFISDKEVIVYRGYPSGDGKSFNSNLHFLKSLVYPQPVEQGAAANP